MSKVTLYNRYMKNVIEPFALSTIAKSYDSNYGDPKLAVPYEQLSKEEQDKDKAFLSRYFVSSRS